MEDQVEYTRSSLHATGVDEYCSKVSVVVAWFLFACACRAGTIIIVEGGWLLFAVSPRKLCTQPSYSQITKRNDNQHRDCSGLQCR